MPKDSFELVALIPATPEQVYEAWLDGDAHGEFTGSVAEVDPSVGGRFTAWAGYIEGKNLELVPGTRIVQTWRTSEFAASDADSKLEILLESEGDGTRLTLRHSEIPAGQGSQYHSGWQEHYFVPMQRHFSKRARPAVKRAAAKRKTAKKPVARKAVKKAASKKPAARKQPARKAAAKKPAARRKTRK